MTQQTILIVEDDKKVVELLKETIQEIGNGFSIKVAFNGKEALSIIEKEKIDLALLDIQMPVMSGAQLLTELCNRKIWFPIIIMTAHSIKEIDHRLLEFGIIDLQNKPLNIEKLKQKVLEVLKSREQRDSISGMGLAAILQILEMEHRTGVMTINTGKRNGRIFFNKGRVVDIEAEGASGEEALGDLLDQSSKNREISIEYLNHRRKVRIDKSLTEILLEASRIIDEIKNKNNIETDDKSEIDFLIDNQPLEKEDKIEHKKFNNLVDKLKEDLGDALLSTQIWSLSEGQVAAGENFAEGVSELFTQITFYMNEALKTAEYPELGRYFIFNLEGGKLSVTIPMGDYFWGILIDSKKTPLGFLLKVILPNQIASFEEAIAS